MEIAKQICTIFALSFLIFFACIVVKFQKRHILKLELKHDFCLERHPSIREL